MPALRTVRVRPPPAARGFTLLEAMAVMAISAIVLAIGLPSFKGMMAKYSIDSQNSSLMDDLLLAREEARNSTSPVSVCASSSGSACDASAWGAGHIVFRDGGAKGSVDAGDTVLRYTKAAPAGITIAATILSSGAAYGPAFVLFEGDGKLDASTALKFTTCKSTYVPLQVTVRRNGYIATIKGSAAC